MTGRSNAIGRVWEENPVQLNKVLMRGVRHVNDWGPGPMTGHLVPTYCSVSAFLGLEEFLCLPPEGAGHAWVNQGNDYTGSSMIIGWVPFQYNQSIIPITVVVQKVHRQR